MLCRWKYADLEILLNWEWKDRVLLRMTPRILTYEQELTEELSMTKEKLSILDSTDFVPMRRISGLSL